MLIFVHPHNACRAPGLSLWRDGVRVRVHREPCPETATAKRIPASDKTGYFRWLSEHGFTPGYREPADGPPSFPGPDDVPW